MGRFNQLPFLKTGAGHRLPYPLFRPSAGCTSSTLCKSKGVELWNPNKTTAEGRGRKKKMFLFKEAAPTHILNILQLLFHDFHCFHCFHNLDLSFSKRLCHPQQRSYKHGFKAMVIHLQPRQRHWPPQTHHCHLNLNNTSGWICLSSLEP